MRAATYILHDAVHLLRPVRDADGEHQERHQDRERIQLEAEKRHQPELPDHSNDRTGDHQGGASYAAGVSVDDGGGDQGGDTKEGHHLDEPVDQLADQLGEADDMDLDLGRLLGLHRFFKALGQLVLVSDLFIEDLGQSVIVDRLATARFLVKKWHEDHARLEIVGHQAAHNARTGDVLLQLLDALRRAVVGVRHDGAALEALFGHFGPANRRGPQRLHPRPIYSRCENQLVVDLLQDFQVLRVEDVAVRVLDHHADGVAQAAQILLVGEIVLDVRLALRN